MDTGKRNNIIEIWKNVVQVQMHFNDIEMRIRGIFVTMVLALAAAQGFLMDKGLSFQVGNVKVLYATFMPVLGIVASALFYFMDRYWYHRLLMGAVRQGAYIEKRYSKDLPELGLTDSIGKASFVKTSDWTSRSGRLGKWIADRLVTDKKYVESGELHSDGKIELFYKSVALLFTVLFIVTFLFSGVLVGEDSLATFVLTFLVSLVCG